MTCPVCNLIIAPFDREKVKVGDREYHGNCFRKEKNKFVSDMCNNIGKVRKPRQTYFRWPATASATIH